MSPNTKDIATPSDETKTHDVREEKAKPGAAWRANEEHVLPENRMPLVGG